MAMFPVFLIGLVVGMGLGYAIFMYVKNAPSSVKIDILTETVANLKEDIKLLETTNEELRDKLATANLKLSKSKRSTTPRKKAE
jgi:prefoldin subunit 5